MSRVDERQLRAVIDDVANALQGTIGLAARIQGTTQTTADDALALRGAIARAVAALKRLPRQAIPAGPGCGGVGVLAIDQDRDRGMGQYFQGFAAENRRHPAQAVRRHHDQIATLFLRGVDDRLIGLFVRDTQRSAIDAGLASLLAAGLYTTRAKANSAR